MDIGDRIIVIGCPGSGKSALAKKLHEITGIPLISLDNIWWKSDRTHISRDEFDCKLSEALSRSRWIIDGNYSRTYEVRIQACDTVIFLDFDEETCMHGILERIGKKRDDIPWVEYSPDPELIALVKNYGKDNHPRIFELLNKYPDKRIFIFRSRSDDDWLDKIRKSRL